MFKIDLLGAAVDRCREPGICASGFTDKPGYGTMPMPCSTDSIIAAAMTEPT